ncbi:MAG: hypothetical protein BV459_04410 [Thermoplasmata archaeon M11B2D]|nr:MAG: hypothetical protein BV459_04410 [Thermoplasmata archaeon M11B2D]
MAKFLGFNIPSFGIKQLDVEPPQQNTSFVPKREDDGAIEVSVREQGGIVAGGIQATVYNPEAEFLEQSNLIIKYRNMALHPEVDEAISNICNDAITDGDDRDVVAIRLDGVKLNNKDLSENIKTKISDEFNNVLRLLDFNETGYERFRDWYIDGRIVYHVIIDDKKPKDGIKEVRWIDPCNIKKVREVIKDRDSIGNEIVKGIREYYMYSEKINVSKSNTAKNAQSIYAREIIIKPEAIVNVSSGRFAEDKKTVVGFLHKSIKPLNDLVSMENAAVIYRLTRAPERRIFYIDVGNLPKNKAEQYVSDMMNRYKNTMVYDATTGVVQNANRHMTMLEDFWLPRREGGKGTEITTLAGGQNLGEIQDIEFFQKKLYRSLDIPLSRIAQDARINFGRQTEINRDELNFAKHINRLRKRYTLLFSQLLEKQVVLKKIMTADEWLGICDQIRFEFLEDAYISESKEAEILKARVELASNMEDAIEKGYYSRLWVRLNVLKQTEEEIEEIKKQREEEKAENPEAESDEDDNGDYGKDFNDDNNIPQQDQNADSGDEDAANAEVDQQNREADAEAQRQEVQAKQDMKSQSELADQEERKAKAKRG